MVSLWPKNLVSHWKDRVKLDVLYLTFHVPSPNTGHLSPLLRVTSGISLDADELAMKRLIQLNANLKENVFEHYLWLLK